MDDAGVMVACVSSWAVPGGGGPATGCTVMASGGSAMASGGGGVVLSSLNNSPGLATVSSSSSCNNILAVSESACSGDMGVCDKFSGGATGISGVGCIHPARDRQLPPPSAIAGVEGGGG